MKESKYLINSKGLMKEWNYAKNKIFNPIELTLGSNKKVWWICENGHEWEATIYSRNKGQGCPYCCNAKVLKGYNDLQTTDPDLAKEWNYNRNGNLKPTDVSSGSNKKVWWICDNGHEWEANIHHRRKNKCPYCNNQKILKGYNDLETTNPDLAKEWNYNRNGNLKPTDVSSGSNKKVWWICNKNHEWEAIIYKRNKGSGCPYCSSRKIDVEYKNSLKNTNPDLAKEWNYNRNGNLKPTDVSSGSHKKVWWICSKGHEWEAVIESRNKGKGCPYCSNQKVLIGYNDLATTNPYLASEWNYEKNGDLKPTDISSGSQISVWWICNKGHEWKTKIDKRNKGNNCPVCGSERKTSISEKTVLYYIQKYYKGNIVSNYRSEIIKNKELDIYISDLKIGIEYDGMFYHKNKKRDIEKDKICNNIGIKVYHIIETKDKNRIDDNNIYYNINNKSDFEFAVIYLLNLLFGKQEYDVDIEKDNIKIYNLMDYYEKELSLSNKFPELIKEWNYEKNGKLKPQFVYSKSSKIVWWTCKKGHEWKAKISSRTAGTGCPYCSNNKVLKGYNDLQSINPEISKEWNYVKNGDLKPTDVSSNSNKRVWWICENSHEWNAKIQNRNKGGKCPYCSNQKALKGYDDLSVTNPELLKFWDYNKNKNLKPENFLNGSNTRIWWKCPTCKKEWSARIVETTRKKSICSFCAKTRK